MGKARLSQWGMDEVPSLEGDPFELARSTSRHAVKVARDVSVDEASLQRFIEDLDVAGVREISHGSMGENCDTLSNEFRDSQEAVNFALFFSLLQFGHGFRYDLHRLCRRGASQTITQGVRNLRAADALNAQSIRSAVRLQMSLLRGLRLQLC